MDTILRRLGAIFYALWGVLSLGLGVTFLMIFLFAPADAFASSGIPADTSEHARALMMQNNVSLAAGGLIVLVAAVRYAWNSPTRAYFVMLGVSSLFTFETVVFELVPGHLGLMEVGAHLALWALATAFATAAYVRSKAPNATPRTPSAGVHGRSRDP